MLALFASFSIEANIILSILIESLLITLIFFLLQNFGFKVKFFDRIIHTVKFFLFLNESFGYKYYQS